MPPNKPEKLLLTKHHQNVLMMLGKNGCMSTSDGLANSIDQCGTHDYSMHLQNMNFCTMFKVIFLFSSHIHIVQSMYCTYILHR